MEKLTQKTAEQYRVSPMWGRGLWWEGFLEKCVLSLEWKEEEYKLMDGKIKSYNKFMWSECEGEWLGRGYDVDRRMVFF